MSRDLDALRFLRRAHAALPEDVFIQKTLADHLNYLGFVAEADAAYRALLREHGPDAAIRRQLGRLCYHRGDLEEALEHLTVLIERGEAVARDCSMALSVALIVNRRPRAEAIIAWGDRMTCGIGYAASCLIIFVPALFAFQRRLQAFDHSLFSRQVV